MINIFENNEEPEVTPDIDDLVQKVVEGTMSVNDLRRLLGFPPIEDEPIVCRHTTNPCAVTTGCHNEVCNNGVLRRIHGDLDHNCSCHTSWPTRTEPCLVCEAMACVFFERPSPREEFETQFGPISDYQWRWLKEFCKRYPVTGG